MCASFKDEFEYKVFHGLKVIRLYDWLLNSFVLDFFVGNHWDKLPDTWKNAFQDTEPPELGHLILPNSRIRRLLPLSFLALKKCLETFCVDRIDRTPKESECQDGNNSSVPHNYTCSNHPRLKNIFLKHVKKKKRHEISLISKLVKTIADNENCHSVVDLGSGLGHLVRTLSYKNGLKSVGIDAQSDLTKGACELDKEFEYSALKCIQDKEHVKSLKPHHINLYLSPEVSGNIFIETLKEHAGDKFGLVGLHPCGDLGPLLLKTFVEHAEIKFICIVGCCYMKLSCGSALKSPGYPLSQFVGNLKIAELSYESREIACHAIETYSERLKKGLFEDLQVHTYRALLEKILISKWPQMKHMGLRSVKHSNTLTFAGYCKIATERLGVQLTESDISSEYITENLKMWKKVVTFYSLRLMLAPLVESVILMDRILYLREQGYICDIRPIFDPEISPRNHILVATKSN